MAQLVKNPPAMEGDLASIPGLGRSPGEGNAFVIPPAIVNIPVSPHPQQNLVI